MRTATRDTPWLVGALAVLFFVSGASALIYQVVWLRKLGLLFGVTVYAASTVWASFMAGLAIGSLLAGRIADRVRRPLVWFGVTEALIGATALATPGLLGVFPEWYAAWYPSLPQSAAFITVVRVILTLAILLVPTALMGATLPLVLKSSFVRAEQLGSRIGLLYATNTSGAIAGTLVSGLYLIPTYGMWRSFVAAAVLNGVVAAGAIALGMLRPPAVPGAAPEAAAAARETGDLPDRTRRAVLIVFALSGFVALALEVIWFRVVVLLIRPTVYGFAMMLGTLLFGIALGSYLAAPLLRRPRRWLAPLAILELTMAVVALLSVQMLIFHPPLVQRLTPIVAAVAPGYLAFSIAASLLVLFPTSLLMGIAFPIGLRLWTGGSDASSPVAARRIGSFYSLNVAGSILGSLAAGFVLLPLLGSRWSLVVVCAIALGSGLVLLWLSGAARRTRLSIGLGFAGLFAAAAVLMEHPLDLFLRLRFAGDRVLWRQEGVQATVSVNRRGPQLILNLEGNHQADDLPGSVGVHRRIGHLPMAVHPFPREALVIGLGGGATAGAVALHTGTDVDVVELSRGVVTAAGFFTHINHGVLTRPNVRLRVDDGRNHLLLSGRKYDVITADLILPIHAGSGNLYSAEYFRLVRNALKEGGLALQWVWGTEAEYKIIMRTFLSVFPEATLWVDGSLMIGSREPLVLRRRDYERKAQVPGRLAGLRELGIGSFDDLVGAYRAGPAEMRAFVGDGPILTDDRPLIEYFLSLPRDRELDVTALKGDVRDRIRD